MPPPPNRPLRVLLVEAAARAPGPLRQALAGLGDVELACALDTAIELHARVAEHRPDVVLIATDSPSRDVLEQLAAVSASAPRPVVMFTGDASDATIRAALEAGVSAYIVDGLAPARLDPIMRVAIERFESERRLRAELEDTRARLAERKLVERAKGLLMQQRGCSEAEAFAALRKLAMQRGLRLGEVAQQVIDVSSLLG